MSEMLSPLALERNEMLVKEAVYEREIFAGLESVWENVFDWEHLPWLHSQAFASIELEASGEWGWRAEVGFPGDTKAKIELAVDRDQNRYVARTLDGAGAPGEIWTYLDPSAANSTKIRVEFWVPKEMQDKVGPAYVALYSGLWDQDETMMQAREKAMAARNGPSRWGAAPPPVDLGSWEALAPRLPMQVEFGGHRFRIVELDGRPVAHSIECPHWLGPLGDCAVEDGVLTCPWHGYRFDAKTGASTEDRKLQLRPAPRIEVDSGTGAVRMVEGSSGGGPREV